ncbi:MFS transporter, partial [Salmonella enterica subsp. enterica serovar Infantis]
HRNMALGVWAAGGSGGAAFGPLIGGRFLEHFYGGSVVLINVPIVLVVMGVTARYVPRQAGRRDQPLKLGPAVRLCSA